MSVTAGELRNQIVFYSKSEVVYSDFAAHGGIEDPDDDSVVYTAWARMRPLSSREMYEAGQIQSDRTHEIIMRYDSNFMPTHKNYFRFGTRYFSIEGTRNTDERNEWIVINATESTVNAIR